MTWSARDEALYLRVSDAALMNRLASAHVGRNVTLHPRSSGLIALLRRGGAVNDALARASAGDAEPLLRALFSERPWQEPPPLLHAKAIYLAEIAKLLPVVEEARVVEARVASLGAWLALRKEKAYLTAFAKDVLSTPTAEDTRLAVDHAFHFIASLAEDAHAGAATFDPAARLAVLALRAAPRACAQAGLTEPEARQVIARTEAALAEITEAALRPIADALDAALASDAPVETRYLILHRVVRAWFYSGYDAAAEQFAVDRATPFAWEVFRQPNNQANRAYLAPLMPLFDSLARRIAEDPLHFAYAARCAEIVLFYAELEPTLDLQIKGAEHVLTICPTHSNGRLMLSQYLCTKATRALPSLPTSANVAEAEALIARAESLYPGTKSIEHAKARVAEAKARSPLIYRP